MRVKVCECATLFWDDGQLVWDDYLRQRQHALTAESEVLLRWFATWRELETARELGDRALAVARRLVEAGILVVEGSAEHDEQERLLARWRAWGSSARHFHFAVRTPAGTGYLPYADDVAHMRERAREEPPPPIAKCSPDRPLVMLPGGEGTSETGGWRRPASSRRCATAARRADSRPSHWSSRSWPPSCGSPGGSSTRSLTAGGPAVLKTSPSAGAWHPVEIYVEARRVAGLAPGVYHFAPTRGGLEDLGRPPLGATAGAALGGQPWLADAPALILYTGVVQRAQWRYRSARAYRDVLIGFGHVSQTLLLTASAMGLGAVFATAVCDEDLERLVGADPSGGSAPGRGGIGTFSSRAGAGGLTWPQSRHQAAPATTATSRSYGWGRRSPSWAAGRTAWRTCCGSWPRLVRRRSPA